MQLPIDKCVEELDSITYKLRKYKENQANSPFWRNKYFNDVEDLQSVVKTIIPYDKFITYTEDRNKHQDLLNYSVVEMVEVDPMLSKKQKLDIIRPRCLARHEMNKDILYVHFTQEDADNGKVYFKSHIETYSTTK